jgi:hypothetical protein
MEKEAIDGVPTKILMDHYKLLCDQATLPTPSKSVLMKFKNLMMTEEQNLQSLPTQY